jgi:DNA-directed RNA polymerase subunit H (RpoH/RPB5)
MSSRDKAHKTCLEMIHQREYTLIEDDENHIIALKPDGNHMVVLFHDAPKFDTKGMKDAVSMMNEMGVYHALIVYQDDVTPATKATLERSVERRFELFCEQDLQINITKHRLQPTFERLPDDEATKFRNEFGTKFGTLRLDKPISRFYDYQKGDVIRIARSDGYINYRIVKG